MWPFSITKRQLLFVNIGIIIIFMFYMNRRLNLMGEELRKVKIAADRQEYSIGRQIVIYNRVPKTASTTFTNAIGYDMHKENKFNILHLNITKNKQIMSLPDQYEFVRNISTWHERLPAFYHGHAAFIDFERFGYRNPIYINMLREPLERLLSHYYFLRFGDNYRVGLKRSRAGNNETFDDCVLRSGKDCDMKQIWMQIPYFCGHHHFCSEVGNARALEEAKRVLTEKYLLVGTTDRMRDLIAMLDASLPSFFKGTLKHFDSLDEKRSHLRNTKKKIPPNDETLLLVKQNEVYIKEREFYDFAVQQFDAVFKKATNGTGKADDIQTMPLRYHYEKIKPEVAKNFDLSRFGRASRFL